MHEDERGLRQQLQEALAGGRLAQHAPRLLEAFGLAQEAHHGQRRAEGLPYLVHPVRVCRVLFEEWGVVDVDALAAALLHDVVEDSELTGANLETRFGPRVSGLVELLTKPALVDGEEKASRDQRYWARLEGGDPVACLVKGADRLDNVRSLLASGWPEAKLQAYLTEAEEQVLPLLGEWPQQALALAGEVGLVRAQIEAGHRASAAPAQSAGASEDLPDVSPHDAPGVTEADDATVYRRSPHLTFFRREAEVFLYHDLVGDIMSLHETVLAFLDYFTEPRSAGEARLAFATDFEPGDFDAFFEVLPQHLCLLKEGEDDREVVSNWYPVAGPWVLSDQPKGGGVTLCYKDRRRGEVAIEPLDAVRGTLFRLCDGARSLGEIVVQLQKRFPQEEGLERRVRATVRAWTHSRRQLLKLIPRPKAAYEMTGLPPYVKSSMPYPMLREGEPIPAEEELSTREYHKHVIRDAEEQFEYRETTISHAFRIPHPALEGRSYGGQLARVLVEREVLPRPRAGRVALVEVGGGVGYFANAFLQGIALRAPELYNRLRYTIVDLSPALRASQRERTKPHADRVRQVGGDATALPLADSSVDFLVCNEVIADLLVSPVEYGQVVDPESRGEGVEAIRRYGLNVSDAPGNFHINTGALRFLEEIARVLVPGGTAFVSEYGAETGYPVQSTHLDHPEFSIHFGHLATAASALGLEVTVEQLAGVMRLRGGVEVLQTTQSSFETLQALLARLGVKLAKVAYTREQLASLAGDAVDLGRIHGLRYGPCGERLLGLRPGEFFAVLLRKPLRAGRQVTKVSLDF